MEHRRSCWVALVAVLSIGLPAVSQCVPEWSATFGIPGTIGQVAALVVHDDGTGAALYAAGSFVGVGPVSANNVAKWNGSSWASVGFGTDQAVTCLTSFDDGFGPALYAGGYFFTAGLTAAERVAKWNGSSWSALGLNTGGFVLALTAYDDGTGDELYAGGNFTTIGGVTANRIAKWNGATWVPLGTGISGSPIVRALVAWDDGGGAALYAGGDFNAAGGVACNRIARWNGTSWAALGTGTVGTNGAVRALAVWDDGSGFALYVGGSFTTAGGVPAAGIAKWNGISWSAVGTGVGGAVHSLAVFDDGAGPALFAGGDFTTAGGAAANRIAKWNGTSWSALGSGISGTVFTLAGFDHGAGPSLLAGGYFSTAGGSASNNLARWYVPRPIVDLAQPGGNGTASVLNSGLVVGHEYFNIFSLETCPGGIGTGPYLGLCVTDVTPLLAQILLPLGTQPFHFIAAGTTSSFGPIAAPPGLVAEAVCFDFTAGALHCWSAVDQLVVQ